MLTRLSQLDPGFKEFRFEDRLFSQAIRWVCFRFHRRLKPIKVGSSGEFVLFTRRLVMSMHGGGGTVARGRCCQ
jgi:hypothetical protein